MMLVGLVFFLILLKIKSLLLFLCAVDVAGKHVLVTGAFFFRLAPYSLLVETCMRAPTNAPHMRS